MPKAVCLLFHRVGEASKDEIGPYSTLSVSAQTFEKVIRFVSEHCHPIALPELIAWHRQNKPLPDKTVVITFDDGFADNWEVAYPILQRYGVPATIYITTGYVEGTIVPYEFRLAQYLRTQTALSLEWKGQYYTWHLTTNAERDHCFQSITKIGKPLRHEEREVLLNKIMPLTDGDTYWPGLFLNWDQVEELAKSPLITIGSHTHSHPQLTVLSHADIVTEAEMSKHLLEKHVNLPISHFAYPYGAYSEDMKTTLRTLGFESAVTTVRQEISATNLDEMAIPRVEIFGGAATESRHSVKAMMSCGY